MGSIIGLWIFVAIAAALSGGPGAAGKVLTAPFRFGGWVLRGCFGAAGQGVRTIIAHAWWAFVRILTDSYNRWPGPTIVGCAIILFAAWLYMHLR